MYLSQSNNDNNWLAPTVSEVLEAIPISYPSSDNFLRIPGESR